MTGSDYVVIGGGTAGCIVASRLSEDPEVTVTVIEAGPSDEHEPRARDIRRWAQMLESKYDLDYRSVPQRRGNSGIRQARMRILGGCSTANTMITWRPLPADLDEWAELGVRGWDATAVHDAYDRILAPIHPVADEDRNPYVADVVDSARLALGLPARRAWNSDPDFAATGVGAGFFEIGYTPPTHLRSSTSVHYLHDAIRERPNLTIAHGRQAQRILIEDGRAFGVLTRDEHGDPHRFLAEREVIVCCGAIDSPKLLQLSGIGTRQVLDAAGIQTVVDSPGVGENLMDHAEGLIVWEAGADVPDTCATGWDAGAAVRLSDEGPARPDVLMHFPVEAVADHAVARGVVMPERIVSIAPTWRNPTAGDACGSPRPTPPHLRRSTTAISRIPTVTTRPSWWLESGWHAGSRPPRRWPIGLCGKSFPDRTRRPTPSCPSCCAPPTKRSTTCRVPAGWARTTIPWRCATPS